MQESMSLKCEPSSEPLHIFASSRTKSNNFVGDTLALPESSVCPHLAETGR